ncbi:MAG: leucyl/phenylalanyl-tRNA--protein transferase [Bacteroidales bacterium]|nr:leucyl/phenylalanyl-tRNA--protein transferase [Bacteroidales bacterium]MBD5206158.1 leucyl/phenylalanyl-tRNA--protein transferase [Bacteroidales bacterium]MBD5302512.1 leucyl/phenylalanyl-tRNA--protein transferase [Bacteroides sp.]
MIYELPDDIVFPDPLTGEPDGELAHGGDLSPRRLLAAYENGIFPWFSFRLYKKPKWYCPLDRFVIFPDEIHISHSVRNLLNKGTYRVTFNKDFDGVINGCAEKRINHFGAWLGEDMIAAYKKLHQLGFAQSVEVWENDKLAGGLYGVTIASCFMGESMFSRKPSASKIALIALAQRMAATGGRMIDCQFETPHLLSMGGRHISYEEYMKILRSPTYKL